MVRPSDPAGGLAPLEVNDVSTSRTIAAADDGPPTATEHVMIISHETHRRLGALELSMSAVLSDRTRPPTHDNISIAAVRTAVRRRYSIKDRIDVDLILRVPMSHGRDYDVTTHNGGDGLFTRILFSVGGTIRAGHIIYYPFYFVALAPMPAERHEWGSPRRAVAEPGASQIAPVEAAVTVTTTDSGVDPPPREDAVPPGVGAASKTAVPSPAAGSDSAAIRPVQEEVQTFGATDTPDPVVISSDSETETTSDESDYRDMIQELPLLEEDDAVGGTMWTMLAGTVLGSPLWQQDRETLDNMKTLFGLRSVDDLSLPDSIEWGALVDGYKLSLVQAIGVSFLLDRRTITRGGYCADAVGLGKTLMTLTMLMMIARTSLLHGDWEGQAQGKETGHCCKPEAFDDRGTGSNDHVAAEKTRTRLTGCGRKAMFDMFCCPCEQDSPRWMAEWVRQPQLVFAPPGLIRQWLQQALRFIRLGSSRSSSTGKGLLFVVAHAETAKTLPGLNCARVIDVNNLTAAQADVVYRAESVDAAQMIFISGIRSYQHLEHALRRHFVNRQLITIRMPWKKNGRPIPSKHGLWKLLSSTDPFPDCDDPRSKAASGVYNPHRPWGSVVIDEIHMSKSSDASLFNTILPELARWPTSCVYGLSATPYETSVRELGTFVEMLGGAVQAQGTHPPWHSDVANRPLPTLSQLDSAHKTLAAARSSTVEHAFEDAFKKFVALIQVYMIQRQKTIQLPNGRPALKLPPHRTVKVDVPYDPKLIARLNSFVATRVKRLIADAKTRGTTVTVKSLMPNFFSQMALFSPYTVFPRLLDIDTSGRKIDVLPVQMTRNTAADFDWASWNKPTNPWRIHAKLIFDTSPRLQWVQRRWTNVIGKHKNEYGAWRAAGAGGSATPKPRSPKIIVTSQTPGVSFAAVSVLSVIMDNGTDCIVRPYHTDKGVHKNIWSEHLEGFRDTLHPDADQKPSAEPHYLHPRQNRADILVTPVTIAGVGLDLQRSHIIISLDPFQLLTRETQMAGRVDRVGKTNSSIMYALRTEGIHSDDAANVRQFVRRMINDSFVAPEGPPALPPRLPRDEA